MKTILSIALVAFAISAPAASLRVGTVRGFPGNTVEVPVALRYGSNELRDVVALQADVLFDASGVSDGTPSSGPALMGHRLASSQPSLGVRRLLVYSLSNATLTNGEVARIPFTVAPGQYRNFTLSLSNVILVRADASQVFASPGNGFIAVSPVYVAPDGHADGFLTVASNAVEQCWVIQATTDFATWVNLQTNNAAGSLLQFIDEDAAGYPHRFYRAVLCDALTGVRLGMVERLADGRVRFEFAGVVGQRYLIQASTNLTQWVNLSTNVANGVVSFADPASTNHAYRFYRVQWNP